MITRLTNLEKKRERTQTNITRNERKEVKANTKELQGIVRKYYKQLYANKLDNRHEMDKFVETYNL